MTCTTAAAKTEEKSTLPREPRGQFAGDAPLGDDKVEGRVEPTIYNRVFWLAYLANVTLVMANALTFRFAEFVRFLGGTEEATGQIVRAGLLGALALRFVLGQGIDGLGVRRIWIASSCLFIAGCSLFLISGDLGWEIYAARVGFSLGLAGMFTCSIAHIQNQVPPERRTEVIGSLGSSGFVGMIVGTQAADLIFRLLPRDELLFDVLFGGVTLLGVAYLTVVLILTRRDVPQRHHAPAPAWELIFRHWPGPVVLVAIMMGIGFSVITVFLTRFSTEQGLSGIGTFFTAYAMTAFAFRVGSRTWSQTIGRHRMIVMGLCGHVVGNLLLITVTADWHFIPPAIACGFGHALLFPCVVSLGAGAFPVEYRGTGTTITLGFVELGTILSAPSLGRIIDVAGFTPMFLTAAAIAAAIAVIYAIQTHGVADSDVRRNEPPVDVALLESMTDADQPLIPNEAR